MFERRQLVGAAALGTILLPGLAAAQTPTPAASGPNQPGPNQPGPGGDAATSASAAARMNELGPENATLVQYAGVWDVTETVWDKPGAAPATTTGLVAERRMIGQYLQEFIRPASSPSGSDIKRIDYLSFHRVEGRWKYVSIEMRAAVGIMPAFSFDRGDDKGIVLVHEPFALPGGGSDVTGPMLRMNTVVTREDRDHDVKNQHFVVPDGAGTVWLAHRYAYARRSA